MSVANGTQNRISKAVRSSPELTRTVFKTSREMDFFSERELLTQIGHPRNDWPLCILKELLDNSLDACEEANIAPVIHITADPCRIKIADNGPGLPESTLQGALDFTVRVSSREAYIAPDRGQQGNALKTIIPMPVVLDPTNGQLVVEAHHKRHVITCGQDPLSQHPVIKDSVTAKTKRGTSVSLEWSPRLHNEDCAFWPFGPSILTPDLHDYRTRCFVEIVEGFAMFNPHATFHLDWFGKKKTWKATNTAWERWKPCKPTSPYWYERRHLERLIGAYITDDRAAGKDRLVSDFVAEFDGLTGSQKRAKVLAETGMKRMRLSELVHGDALDGDRVESLLAAMRKHTKPVKPQRLGLIGEEHLKFRLLAMGVQPESFRYNKKLKGPKCKNLQSVPDFGARGRIWLARARFRG
jgi:hypothetical protein